MKNESFFLTGKNKNILVRIKKVLLEKGYACDGYCDDPLNALLYIYKFKPQIIFIAAESNFDQLRQIINTINKEMLAFCIIILDIENKQGIEFINHLDFTTDLTIPVNKDIVPQIFKLSLTYFTKKNDKKD
jgi:hypothetical protein